MHFELLFVSFNNIIDIPSTKSPRPYTNMKLILLSASLLSAATLVAATPGKLVLRQAAPIPDDLNPGSMVFTGRVELGGPNVTLSGNAQVVIGILSKIDR